MKFRNILIGGLFGILAGCVDKKDKEVIEYYQISKHGEIIREEHTSPYVCVIKCDDGLEKIVTVQGQKTKIKVEDEIIYIHYQKDSRDKSYIREGALVADSLLNVGDKVVLSINGTTEKDFFEKYFIVRAFLNFDGPKGVWGGVSIEKVKK